MSNEVLVEMLMKFGLSRQESLIYLCLCSNGALTGYEASKQTGISRSNVYGALAGLVDKGASDVEESASMKYVAVNMEEFTANYLKHLSETRDDLIRNAPTKVEFAEGYLTLNGYQHILDKISYMFQNIEQRVYISAKEDMIALFAESIAKVVKEKKKFVIIADGFFKLKKQLKNFLTDEEIGGIIFYHAEKKETQLRMIVDSKYVLTGELTGSKADTALYSAQTNFVNVFKEALHNEIKLIEITGGKENE